MRPLLLVLSIALAAAWAGTARADQPANPDTGVYHVYVGEQTLGIETFSFKAGRDSLFLVSHAMQTFPTSSGADTLDKFVQMIIGRSDETLHWYQSNQRFRGRNLIRGLVLHDTTYTAFREDEHGGIGDTRVRPPGKLYVIDAQSFMVFDLLCRDFFDKNFSSRPINLLVLGARDTLVEGRIEDLGTEEIRWGYRPVQARKLRIADETTEFIAWVSPVGYMVRLEQPDANLRIERAPPPVKRRRSG